MGHPDSAGTPGNSRKSGFSDRTWLADRYPHTDGLRMTERYRRTDCGHLEAEVIFEDPGAYSKPWKARTSALLAVDTEMLESYCENPENGREHWVGKLSDFAKSAVEVDPEVLRKYAGAYKGIWASRPRLAEITFSGTALFVALEGNAPEPLIPQSPTQFAGNSGLQYQFVLNAEGVATHLIETHVTGNYKYERQK